MLPGMELVTHPTAAIDLTTTPIHLGVGSTARAIEGFSWDPAVLAAYGAATAADGADGRRGMTVDGDADWTTWERPPHGDEVVVCLAGRATIQWEDGSVELGPGTAMVNPAGSWHTADVHEPTRLLTITPGAGTEHRPR